MRIVDIALPAGGGAGLFEIHAHDQHKGVGNFVSQLLEAAGVVEPGDRIVDRAGADDHENSRVFAVEDGLQGLPTFEDNLGGSVRQRNVGGDFLGEGMRSKAAMFRFSVWAKGMAVSRSKKRNRLF